MNREGPTETIYIMKRPIKKSICDTVASPTEEKTGAESVEAHGEETQKTGTHKHTEAAKKTTHTVRHVHTNTHSLQAIVLHI